MIFAADCMHDRTVLVTGASSGLGRATANLLARCGARIILNGRDAARLEETRLTLSGDGHETIAAELSNADQAHDLTMAAVARVGTLDGVFHSAGTTKVLPVKLVKDKQLDDVFGANLWAAFGIARAAAKRDVVRDGGALIFMSSVAAVCGRPALSAYCAAKAGLDGMVRSIAVEMAPRRIRVNSIAAGAVETAMHDTFVSSINEEARRDYEDFHLLKFGVPEDIANMAVFLLSDGGRWITGASLAVDGGAAAK
ncbi:SDR family NAD(P)-dependent oxidoreductase [Sphingomonas sp. 8AM]|uniref:SDR family NAD(P)-dependent oxidoreductase n=1 Tax=Sphingomonas sp. 8AM TaxID=2653170 RepID=UPI0012F271A5|nr:SDR family oxidoreductase [Sphingomonas sp. 8AM]VXD01018.1 Short-chain dehydrogenase [Sphingomonas sp. 8AM]